MEILRRYVVAQASGFGAYMALQRTLMQRFVARGGSAEEFCARLSPAFHKRYAPLLLGDPGPSRVPGDGERASPRPQQEKRSAA